MNKFKNFHHRLRGCAAFSKFAWIFYQRMTSTSSKIFHCIDLVFHQDSVSRRLSSFDSEHEKNTGKPKEFNMHWMLITPVVSIGIDERDLADVDDGTWGLWRIFWWAWGPRSEHWFGKYVTKQLLPKYTTFTFGFVNQVNELLVEHDWITAVYAPVWYHMQLPGGICQLTLNEKGQSTDRLEVKVFIFLFT